jgi:hypothetical protein
MFGKLCTAPVFAHGSASAVLVSTNGANHGLAGSHLEAGGRYEHAQRERARGHPLAAAAVTRHRHDRRSGDLHADPVTSTTRGPRQLPARHGGSVPATGAGGACLDLVSARTGLWMLIAGSVLAMVVAVFRGQAQPAAKPVKAHAHERPWLTHEAMQQVVGEGGGPGPLFADLTLGGPRPPHATRDRIAAFANANGIEIQLDVTNGELAAIRVGVTFGGCCGYEGADTLGRLLHRTNVEECCCECRGTPADDWTTASDDGIAIHGHVAVNRIDVRWEAMLTLPELLDRAEAIVGKPRATVRAHAGDRWHDRMIDQVIDVPFVFASDDYAYERGLHVTAERGRIADVSFSIRGLDTEELGQTLRKRWGKPRETQDTWIWRAADRVITVDPSAYPTTFVIHASAPATTTALARAAATPAPRS